MLDAMLQAGLGGPLSALSRRLAARGVGGEAVLVAGFAAGLAAAVLAASGVTWVALALLLVNRLCGALEKGMDGPGAGGPFAFYLATTLELVFWGAFVLAFAFTEPGTARAAAFLLFALMTLGGSALAFALAGVRRGLAADVPSASLPGFFARLVEQSEVTLAFALICLLPGYFAAIAVLLAFAALATAIGRGLVGWRVLRH
jgi:hypothetical protein